MIQGLQGYTVVRNAFLNDYSLRECVDSMLSCCEKVLVCDSDSTDGTREFLDRWADNEPRLEIINYPWPNPKGDAKFFTTWLNFARERLTLSFQLQLDADEVLDDSPECHQRIEEAVKNGTSLACDRLNYWKSPQWLIPEGHCIGKRVVRVGRTEWWMPSDEGGYKHGDLPMLDNAADGMGSVRIHHVGFLRKPDAFYRKAKVVLDGFFGGYDKRLEATEANKQTVCEVPVEWADMLVPYEGHIPDNVQRWFVERGHDCGEYLPKRELREDAKILIEEAKSNEALSVLHSGDLGDIVAGMSVFKAIGKVRLFVVNRGITKPIVERFHYIKDLLLSQGYIESAEVYNGEPIHWNASDFRHNYTKCTSLAQAHALHFSGTNIRPIKFDASTPWLLVEPDMRWSGRIVINRSPRYHNEYFQWRKIVNHYGDKLVFIGHRQEYDAFCQAYGSVEYHSTANLLECAKMIAASALFIGNQSSCMNIAEGLKHRRIQETCITRPDCIYGDSAVQYVVDGACVLPAIGDSPRLEIMSAAFDWREFDLKLVPKVKGVHGWQYAVNGEIVVCESMSKNAAKKLQKIIGGTEEECREKVVMYCVKQAPQFFSSRINKSKFAMVVQSLREAGIKDHSIFNMAEFAQSL